MSFQYFTLDEFACTETGLNEIKPLFVSALDRLRAACDFPFVITSGYRSPEHSEEKAKPKPGYHSKGIAADIVVHNSNYRYVIVQKAMARGFTGIGIGKTFVHLDTRPDTPRIWTY